jgi:hypothetical protein
MENFYTGFRDYRTFDQIEIYLILIFFLSTNQTDSIQK